jgi:hypothetical protein
MAILNTTRQVTIPSYSYVQYNDDKNIGAFFSAYNVVSQSYIDAFNTINLPNWSAPKIVDYLLDWVATGLYGNPRPVLLVGNVIADGPYNTDPYNSENFNFYNTVNVGQFFETTDDIYKRVLTWNLYKGDGKQFNISWLKRRCIRFLIGTNGFAPFIQETYPISVAFNTVAHPGTNVVTITINTSKKVITSEVGAYDQSKYDVPVYNDTTLGLKDAQYQFSLLEAEQLKEVIESGAVNLPFGYSFHVDIVNII